MQTIPLKNGRKLAIIDTMWAHAIVVPNSYDPSLVLEADTAKDKEIRVIRYTHDIDATLKAESVSPLWRIEARERREGTHDSFVGDWEHIGNDYFETKAEGEAELARLLELYPSWRDDAEYRVVLL